MNSEYEWRISVAAAFKQLLLAAWSVVTVSLSVCQYIVTHCHSQLKSHSLNRLPHRTSYKLQTRVYSNIKTISCVTLTYNIYNDDDNEYNAG